MPLIASWVSRQFLPCEINNKCAMSLCRFCKVQTVAVKKADGKQSHLIKICEALKRHVKALYDEGRIAELLEVSDEDFLPVKEALKTPLDDLLTKAAQARDSVDERSKKAR